MSVFMTTAFGKVWKTATKSSTKGQDIMFAPVHHIHVTVMLDMFGRSLGSLPFSMSKFDKFVIDKHTLS